MTGVKSFRNLDESIKSGNTKITLDSDIEITPDELAEFAEGIKIDVGELVIDGANHTINSAGNAMIFNIISGILTLENITLTNAADAGETIYNHDRLKLVGCSIKNSIHNAEKSILKSDNTNYLDSSEIINDGTLILMGPRPTSVINNSLLYLPEGARTDNVTGEGSIVHFHELTSNENSFTHLKRQIEKCGEGLFKNVRHLIYNDDGEKLLERFNHVVWGNDDSLIRFKGDVILDIYNDECFEFSKGLEIDKEGIIIDGQGYSIDSKGFSRIFTVSSKDLTLQNLTLRNGYANVGGAIKNTGGKIRMASVTVKDSSASKNGGAIYNENGKVFIKRTYFKNNWAVNGGAIYNDGELIMDFAKFSNNQKNSLFNMGRLIINDSKFVTQNSIENNGIMKIWNNSFDDTNIINQSQSLLKAFVKRPAKNETVYQSASLTITNHGTFKTYRFKDNIIPSCTITGEGSVLHNARDEYLNDVIEHYRLVNTKSTALIGKKDELRFLDDKFYNHTSNILLVKGEEGVGKNTLLCKWHVSLQGAGHKSIIRLCEATSKSNTLKDVYLSIGSDVGILNGDEEAITRTNFDFDEEFFNRLKDKGIEVLIISNIDKLDSFNFGNVPNGFFLVLSTGMDYELEEDHEYMEVGGWEGSEERFAIINKYMGGSITDQQKEHLQSNLDFNSPLFIDIVLNELKNSNAYDNLEEEIKKFGDSIYSAFTHLIEILENDSTYPKGFVKNTLSLLAYSGNGLDEDALLLGLDYTKNQDEYIKGLLDRIRRYVLFKNNRYFIGYEQFRNAIADRYSNEAETRRNLVELYKKSMLRAAEDVNYADIAGSDDLLNQLELLCDYDGIIEVFGTDELFDKILPSKYGVGYKKGEFYERSDEKLGTDIGNYKKTDVLGKIALILLEKANKTYQKADNDYLKSQNKSLDYGQDEFMQYKDAFYDPPVYYKASTFYAERYLDMATDPSKIRQFWDDFEKSSQDLIQFFSSVSQTGAEDLGLGYQFQDMVFEAVVSKDRLDAYVQDLGFVLQ